MALQYHERWGSGTLGLSNVTSGEVEVFGGSLVSLEVRKRYLVAVQYH